MRPKVKIIVERKGNIVAACLEGNQEKFVIGRTSAEAIGNFIQKYPDKFNIEIDLK